MPILNVPSLCNIVLSDLFRTLPSYVNINFPSNSQLERYSVDCIPPPRPLIAQNCYCKTKARSNINSASEYDADANHKPRVARYLTVTITLSAT